MIFTPKESSLWPWFLLRSNHFAKNCERLFLKLALLLKPPIRPAFTRMGSVKMFGTFLWRFLPHWKELKLIMSSFAFTPPELAPHYPDFMQKSVCITLTVHVLHYFITVYTLTLGTCAAQQMGIHLTSVKR
jgi:hypothetical protein